MGQYYNNWNTQTESINSNFINANNSVKSDISNKLRDESINVNQLRKSPEKNPINQELEKEIMETGLLFKKLSDMTHQFNEIDTYLNHNSSQRDNIHTYENNPNEIYSNNNNLIKSQRAFSKDATSSRNNQGFHHGDKKNLASDKKNLNKYKNPVSMVSDSASSDLAKGK